MVLALCVGLVLVGRARWGWVAVAGAVGILISKLTFAPLALGLTLGTRRPLACLAAMAGILLAVWAGLTAAGADMLSGLRSEGGAPIMGANLLALLTLVPEANFTERLRGAFLAAGMMLVIAAYALWWRRLRGLDDERRSRATEAIVFSIYLIVMLFSHKSLSHYRIPFFLPAACLFITAGQWNIISRGRAWACVGYSLLVGLYTPFWEKWIYVLPYRLLWLPADERPVVPGTTAALQLFRGGAMFVATAAMLAIELVACWLMWRDAGRSVSGGREATASEGHTHAAIQS
jgi:hypothetical protein